MDKIDGILSILPDNLGHVVKKYSSLNFLNEIRIRVNKPMIMYSGGRELKTEYVISKEDMSVIVKRMSNFSIYAYDDELRQGYITVNGGHRIGICGRCVIEDDKVKTIKDISSINIRVCREIRGCAKNVLPYIADKYSVLNTIIISPPKCGKTTLIRDISRNISNGFGEDVLGRKVCIIDERSEIGACYFGIPQLDIGERTDILDGCPKSAGIMMAVRSMAPDVLICDEIGTYEDVKSIMMAMCSGVKLITTIHGFGIDDLYNRAVFKEIMENNVFKRAIILSNKKGIGTVEYIYDFPKKEMIYRCLN